MAKPPKIFVSYSHKDKAWLKRLQVHFKALERDGTVDLWDDTEIKFGADWDAEIASSLDHAKAAILLVSADFLASDYIINEELKDLLEAGEKRGLLILIVILRPCVLGKLGQFQLMNNPEDPLEGMNIVEQEKVFVNLVKTIKKVLTIDPKTSRQEPQRKAGIHNLLIPHLRVGVDLTNKPDQATDVRAFHQERISIGRDPASDLLLSDPHKQVVSKQHAEITYQDDRLYVTDLDSMNFTYLNDARILSFQAYEIQPDSKIRIGPFEIRILSQSTKPNNDRTEIDIVNPYKDNVELLVTALRSIGAQFTKETSRRDQVMLLNALRDTMMDVEQNEADILIAHWLFRNIDH